MRLSPEDPELRKALRQLAKLNIPHVSEETIMFLDNDCNVVEAVYPREINTGGHRVIRDRLVDQARLRAILHLGLIHDYDRERQCYIHVVGDDVSGNELDRLMTLRQVNRTVYWVPTTAGARVAWQRRWVD